MVSKIISFKNQKGEEIHWVAIKYGTGWLLDDTCYTCEYKFWESIKAIEDHIKKEGCIVL